MNYGMMPDSHSSADDANKSRLGRVLAMVVIVVLVCIGAITAWYNASNASEPPVGAQATPSDSTARAPAGSRVKVRVLNATGTRGLAKKVTVSLRDFGYDVVDFDSDPRNRRTSTLIVSHTGHDAWAQRLRRALGTGAIEARADSLRYVDFTVFVGSDWKSSTQAFRP